MSKEEQKCKDAGYTKYDVSTDSVKDIKATLKFNNTEFKAIILRMTRYTPPPLRVAKTCFTSHKLGRIFVEICIDENNEENEEKETTKGTMEKIYGHSKPKDEPKIPRDVPRSMNEERYIVDIKELITKRKGN